MILSLLRQYFSKNEQFRSETRIFDPLISYFSLKSKM